MAGADLKVGPGLFIRQGLRQCRSLTALTHGRLTHFDLDGACVEALGATRRQDQMVTVIEPRGSRSGWTCASRLARRRSFAIADAAGIAVGVLRERRFGSQSGAP